MKKLLMLIVLMSGPVLATDRNVDVDVKVMNGGSPVNIGPNKMSQTVGGNSATVGGSSNKAFSYGPDVDINDCMAHWSAVVVTVPSRNKFCESQELVLWAERAELHTTNSVRIMCSTKIAKEVFDGRDNCIDAFSPVSPGPVDVPGIYAPTPGPDDQETRPDAVPGAYATETYGGDGHVHVDEKFIQQVSEVEGVVETLEQRVIRIEQLHQAAARKAQQRREFAQQTIERLENDPE